MLHVAWRFFRNVVLILIGSVVLFALVEGMASLALFAGGIIRRSREIGERKHTTFDTEIGWIGAPNVRIPDLYAPGIGLTSNSRGFRGSREVAREVPPGRRRIVCSGDSFTLGYGVRDEETWCEQLAAMDSGIETANLGMGGYGIDQMYLWYRRNGGSIDHDLHVLAVIGLDFERVRADETLGAGKPLLQLRNGQLAVRNQIVQRERGSWLAPYWRHAGRFASALRTSQLLRALGWKAPGRDAMLLPVAETKEIVTAILGDLQRIARERSSGLLLLYIPSVSECDGDGVHVEWRSYWRGEASRRRLPFLDLTGDCVSLGKLGSSRLYLQAGTYNVTGVPGHHSALGHRFVAEKLLPLVKSALVR